MSTPITIKWGKQTLNLSIKQGTSGSDLKEQIHTLTNVPPTRQKLLCPKLWKGALKDTDIITTDDNSIPINTKITLIGTADELVEKSMDERPRFVEDMTPEEVWNLKRMANKDKGVDEGPIIDIIALQKEYGMDRDDGKTEMYEYSRLTTGLPQQQINDMLLQRMEKKEGEGKDQSTNSTELKGDLAMTMGLQLRRAYINSLAVLGDGTLISGLDDGHVQFWRRCEMIKDARHTGGCVDEVIVLPSSSRDGGGPAFATAGDGSICIWSHEYNHIATLPCFPGTTVASMTVGSITSEEEDGARMYLAACFRITRQTDPNQFRLPPQNEMERRRREAAEMQEQMIQNQVLEVSRRIKVWWYDASQSQMGQNGGVAFNEELISPQHVANTEERVPSITKLADMAGNLVCGDVMGLTIHDATHGRTFQKKLLLLFQYLSEISCMEPLHDNLLAVSISRTVTKETPVSSSAIRLQMPTARGVYIVDTERAAAVAVLDGHRDRVTCICPLPDGTLLTAGGKFDATVQLWRSETLTEVTKRRERQDEIKVSSDSNQMKNPGYVFDLKVLPDNNGSTVFAIAAARYNSLNIIT